MPTGYTAPIEDREDFTFEEFVWRCARGFGAFVMQRHDSCDAPRPREQVPSQWHERELRRARAELAAAEAMSDEEAGSLSREEFEVRRVEHAASAARQRAVYERYMAMRKRAEEWTPPTPEHVGLRRFMLEQIDLCTRHMDPTGGSAPALMAGPEWRAVQIKEAKWRIEYHEKGWREEQKRIRGANAWVDALVASVPPPKGALL